ncbi:hypothetical protein GCM10022198_10070 [Klugiella xanthotipulae]|uniref:Glycosyl transferase family 2 n=1 Tax=Klugiella xanthotipulae TaxID=244735 RepID=A0A543HYS5_9MICO|nr:glycosyltransferase [Klugiella xanthotipulae]TQM63405.1 glycosyl transferase family 2 [Klugiella xanthotipulae]
MTTPASAPTGITRVIERAIGGLVSRSTLIDLKSVIQRPLWLRSRLVHKEYYESQLDRTFPSLHAAERHYLTTGWKMGLLPNQFCVAPEARADIYASRHIREWVLAATPVEEPELRLITPDYGSTVPRATRHTGGIVGHQLSRLPSQLRHAHFRDADGRMLTWDDVILSTLHNRMVFRTIAASPLFDLDYYAAQTGLTFLSREAAINHYLETGEILGYSPSPLFEPEWYLNHLVEYQPDPTVNQLFHFLSIGQDAPASPIFDGHRYGELFPEAPDHPGGRAGHFLERAETDRTLETCPSNPNVPHPEWVTVRERALTAAAEYCAHRALTGRGLPPTPPQRLAAPAPATDAAAASSVTILVSVTQISVESMEPINTLLAQTHTDWELLICGTAEEALSRTRFVNALVERDPRIRVVTTEGRRTAALNEAADAGTRQTITVWNGSEAWSPDRLSSLLTTGGTDTGLRYAQAVWASGAAADVPGYTPAERQLWLGPTSLRGFLVSYELFIREGRFSTDLDALVEWDFLVRTASIVTGQRRGRPAERPGPEAPPALSPPVDRDLAIIQARTLERWDEVATGLPQRNAALSSILLYVRSGWENALTALTALRATTPADVEIIVVCDGTPRSTSAVLTLASLTDRRVQIIRTPARVERSVALNLACARSTGNRIVLADENVVVADGWFEALSRVLARDGVAGVQPLLLDSDDTVFTAGTVYAADEALPSRFLSGFPGEDGVQAEGYAFAAACGLLLMVPAAAFCGVAGFRAAYLEEHGDTDLCQRITRTVEGHFRTVTETTARRLVAHSAPLPADTAQLRAAADSAHFQRAWSETPARTDREVFGSGSLTTTGTLAGRRLPGTSVRRAHFQVARPARRVPSGPAAGLPSLRWAIKNPAHAGPRGAQWGDTFFANDLAAGLRALGQEVVIDRQPAHERPDSTHLDDVTVTLRGLERFVPQPGATNILWIISHPELVTTDELTSGYQLVYAASTGWASEASAQLKIPVRPLLQAANTQRFHPRAEPHSAAEHDVLFVGRTRRVFRPIVRDAIEAGARLDVYGDDWETFIPAHFVKAHSLPNATLPEAYRTARIVLNDHWSVMAAQGFYSNRLFEAVASGARVISDPVEGIEELFHGTVKTYGNIDELRLLLAEDSPLWPDEVTFRRAAEAVAREHTFVRRAQTLLGDVLTERGIAHPL